MKQTLLRTTVISFLFIFCSLSLRSQWVSIPDTNFGKWLNTNGHSSCLQGSSQLGWQVDTTCNSFVNITTLNFVSLGIVDLTGIQYCDRLRKLTCSSTPLNNLPALPATVTYLNIGQNQLPALPPLPPGIDTLWVYRNQLTSLPTLPPALKYLDCAYNQISSMPALPAGLLRLQCGANLLTSLPAIPSGVYALICFRNQLSSLPVIPPSVTSLWCYENQITSLPTLPPALRELGCNDNLLTSLPALPSTLMYLDCFNNQISSLPAFPDSLNICRVHNNPLYCLPQLKWISTLNFTNTNVTCLPNYGTVLNSTPRVDTIPLCNAFNSNGCELFWNISGRVYLDTNSNCMANNTESGVINIPMLLRSNGAVIERIETQSLGNYSFDTDTGNYEVRVDTSNLPFYVTCPVNGVYYDTLTAVDSVYYSRNFALQCWPGMDLAAWSIYGRFRPGDTRNVHIYSGNASSFYGVNCVSHASGTVTVIISGPAEYVSPAGGALIPCSVAGDTVTYCVSDFSNTSFFNSFNMMVRTDTSATIGSTICFTVIVTADTADYAPANNIQTHCFTVVGSFDPNDKQVYPATDIDTTQEWLTYTINFQNTGTDTAIHIYVTDTLDSDLDASSFQLLAYSHQPMVQIKQNQVRFNFPNIMLVDSHANEPLSHGYVQYKIKLKDNLPIGTQINNTAFIYFDFNAPVVTNTTTNTIAVISGISKSAIRNAQFEMFPNPASNSVTISVDENMIGSTVTIADVTGRKMAAVQLETLNLKFATEAFSNGVYFVTVTDKEGRSPAKKLVINK